MHRVCRAADTSDRHIAPGATTNFSITLLAVLAGACGAPLSEHTPTTAANPVSSPAAASGSAVATPRTVEGQVLDPAGEPLVGALVSACGRFDPQLPDPGHDVFSDAQGRFRFVELPPGRYGVTATSEQAAGVYSGVVVVPSADGQPQRVILRSGAPGITLQGTVRDDQGAPLAGARVLAAAFSENEGETYVTQADAQGRYLLHLPPSQRYMLAANAGARPRAWLQVDPISQVVDFRLDPLTAIHPL